MRRLCLTILAAAVLMSAISQTSAELTKADIEEIRNIVREEIQRTETYLDKRITESREDMNKRFEQVDKRFEQIITFMWMLVVIFLGITGTTIGFAIWDRRSMIRPFEDKVEELRKTDQRFLEVLKNLATEDKRLAEVLRKFDLL